MKREDLVDVGADGAGELAQAAAVATAAVVAPQIVVPALVAAKAIQYAAKAIFLDRVRGRDISRAQDVIERLVLEDENPEEFDEFLTRAMLDENDEVWASVRHLLRAALDAPTKAGLQAMTRLARAHLRSRLELWIARGGLEVFCESTDAELRSLRALLGDVVRHADQPALLQHASTPFRPTGFVLFAKRDHVMVFRAQHKTWTFHSAPIGPRPAIHLRLFQLLKGHMLATEVSELPKGVEAADAIGLQMVVVDALFHALGGADAEASAR